MRSLLNIEMTPGGFSALIPCYTVQARNASQRSVAFHHAVPTLEPRSLPLVHWRAVSGLELDEPSKRRDALIRESSDFEVDRALEETHFFTFNPRGDLRRVR